MGTETLYPVKLPFRTWLDRNPTPLYQGMTIMLINPQMTRVDELDQQFVIINTVGA
jgi:hypothetical protein